MTLEDVRHIISQGEGTTIEFKDATGGTPSSFYESAVSVFPDDAHEPGLAPSGRCAPVKKVVMKVPVG